MAYIFYTILMLFVGSVLGVITMCLCMAGRDGDTESELMEQANEILNLRLENEYLHMWQVEVRESVEKMEPPRGFTSVYNHAYNDAIDEIRRIVE